MDNGTTEEKTTCSDTIIWTINSTPMNRNLISICEEWFGAFKAESMNVQVTYLLNTHSVPGTISGSGDTAMNLTYKIHALIKLSD